MAECIYWILASILVLVLIIFSVRNIIVDIQQSKKYKEIDEKELEYIKKQIKFIEKMEEK